MSQRPLSMNYRSWPSVRSTPCHCTEAPANTCLSPGQWRGRAGGMAHTRVSSSFDLQPPCFGSWGTSVFILAHNAEVWAFTTQNERKHVSLSEFEKPSCFLLYVAFQTVSVVCHCLPVTSCVPCEASVLLPRVLYGAGLRDVLGRGPWGPRHSQMVEGRWTERGSRVMDTQDSSCLTLTSAYNVLQDSKLQSLSTSYLQHPQQPLHREGPCT